MDLEKQIKKQAKKISELEALFRETAELLQDQLIENEELREREKSLRKIIDQLTKPAIPVKKNSRNSNLPPSKDMDKPNRNKSLRKRSGKKPGGQKGHTGHKLEMRSNPDWVYGYYPEQCIGCGEALKKEDCELDCSKQEIDIPPLQPIVTQYDRYKTKCNCGRCNYGILPSRLRSRIQYGPRVRTIINYSLVYQYLPYRRLKEMLSKLFGINLSEGTINNVIKSSSEKAKGLYEGIKNYISISDQVGADETPIRINGKRGYLWVWQNKGATYISSEKTRRKDVIYDHFPHGFPNATLISDRYSAHLFTPAKNHQICWVHLQRRINYLLEEEKGWFPRRLRVVYEKSLKLSRLKKPIKKGSKRGEEIERELNRILTRKIDKKKYPETSALQRTLLRHRQSLLTFMYDPSIPSHNNGSEQAIRNAKVKMKISGFFKSGQQSYAILRSIIDTLIKNKKPVFESLFNLEINRPILLGFE